VTSPRSSPRDHLKCFALGVGAGTACDDARGRTLSPVAPADSSEPFRDGTAATLWHAIASAIMDDRKDVSLLFMCWSISFPPRMHKEFSQEFSYGNQQSAISGQFPAAQADGGVR
jgi:hypothetical protein